MGPTPSHTREPNKSPLSTMGYRTSRLKN
uniref:Uncharacterized protein n=1 Tax=Vitis vinifera TaxID=29760 RepID=F6HTX1_VITVI